MPYKDRETRNAHYRKHNSDPNVIANKRRYRETHRKELREANKTYWKTIAQTDRWLAWYVQHHYGITIEDYILLWEEQKELCAIDGCFWKLDTGPRRPHIDHDKETGLVRGLLCGPHNIALGLVKEDEVQLLGMINYLRKGRV